jgi:hypothetical protein
VSGPPISVVALQIHELTLIVPKDSIILDLSLLSILATKPKQARETHVISEVSLAFDHPINGVLRGAEVEGGEKLKNNLLVPIIVKTCGILDSLPLTRTNHQVKIWIMLACHIIPINPLHLNYGLLVAEKYGEVIVRMELSVKAIIYTFILLILDRAFLDIIYLAA